MSVALDVNVLVYATHEGSPYHRTARELLDELTPGVERVYLFWPVVVGYLKIVTSVAALGGPLEPDVALDNVDALLDMANVVCPGEEAGFWRVFRPTAHAARGKTMHDAHLVALMKQWEVGTIYTHDRDFRRFDGIRVRDPFA